MCSNIYYFPKSVSEIPSILISCEYYTENLYNLSLHRWPFHSVFSVGMINEQLNMWWEVIIDSNKSTIISRTHLETKKTKYSQIGHPFILHFNTVSKCFEITIGEDTVRFDEINIEPDKLHYMINVIYGRTIRTQNITEHARFLILMRNGQNKSCTVTSEHKLLSWLLTCDERLFYKIILSI